MTKLEKDIETKLRQMVERHGGKCLKWVCPGWAGVPDRIVLLPRGLVVFVELKRPAGGKVSKMQEWWADELARLGFQYRQIWTETDLVVFKAIYLDRTGRIEPCTGRR